MTRTISPRLLASPLLWVAVLFVALLVGMHTANQSVLHAFNDTVERIAGKAQLQVTAGDTGFSEDVLERVQSLREVRAAAPVIETEADPGIPGQGKLLILAVDMTGDRTLRDWMNQFTDREELLTFLRSIYLLVETDLAELD